MLETLAERGALHERDYVDHLTSTGAIATSIDGVGIDATAVAATREALGRGDPIIVQAALQSGVWSGRADVLRRVDKPSQYTRAIPAPDGRLGKACGMSRSGNAWDIAAIESLFSSLKIVRTEGKT